MSEHLKEDSSSGPQQVELDVLTILRKMQQQLVYLEKKIDALIKQSSERPSFGNKDRGFSRPFRPGGFSRSHHGKGERSGPPREGNFSQDRPPFGRPQGGENREFGKGRKAFFRRQQKNRG